MDPITLLVIVAAVGLIALKLFEYRLRDRRRERRSRRFNTRRGVGRFEPTGQPISSKLLIEQPQSEATLIEAGRTERVPFKAEAPFKAERRSLLSNREREMFGVLKKAFPEPNFTVLSQVSMQALITTPKKDQGARNRYDKKYVDFVICSPSLFVIAVIELDDCTHDRKQDKDAERDAMLASAGIRTVRYRQIPHHLSVEALRADVFNSENSADKAHSKHSLVAAIRRGA
ncbi:MAG: DUF2726 domain-containing protein [Brachymonas sp.]|nr:DUF2726 domain-containing protein [Brachymonas sp.]